MKHRAIASLALAAIAASAPLLAQPAQNANVPKIRFESVPDFLKYSPDMNLGEVLGVAINSKGTLAVLNHPGSATVGPLYGNASTQILEFDANGKFVREVGKGVYGLGYGHGIRYDKYDNLWVVDKGTHAVTKFNPGRLRHAESRPAARRAGRAGVLQGRPRRRAGAGARSTATSAGRPTSPGTATTTSTSATATPIRASPSSTSTATG